MTALKLRLELVATEYRCLKYPGLLIATDGAEWFIHRSMCRGRDHYWTGEKWHYCNPQRFSSPEDAIASYDAACRGEE